MVLDPLLLESKLREFMDESYSGFVGWPANDAEAAQAWGDAIDAYVTGITPVSTTVAAAKAALVLGLSGLSAPGAAVALLDASFAAYAATVGGGMAPAFVAVPPLPGTFTLALSPVLVANAVPGVTGPVAVAALAACIDLWFRTGTATPSGGGPPVPWA